MFRWSIVLLLLTIACFHPTTNSLPELALLAAGRGRNFIPTDGRVKSFQKIDDLTGGLTGGLEDAGFFGRGSIPIGDLDGDGVVDLAVSAWADDDGGLDRGAVWILFMNANGTVRSQQVISELFGNFSGAIVDGDYFGYSLAALGDLDGDGIPDIASGAPKANDGGTFRGALWILFLNRNGTVKSRQKIATGSGGFSGILANNDQFATNLNGPGDMDGDGIPDLISSVPSSDDGGTDRGGFFILYLNRDGTVKSHQKISNTSGGFTGTLQNSDAFGGDIAIIGDLDGDGVRDIAVGASGSDDGGTDRGAVWILFMNANGTVKSQRKINSSDLSGTLADSDLLGGVGMIGPNDLNGDGIPDLVAGAVGTDDGGTDRGAALVLFLNRDGSVLNFQKISGTQGNFNGALANSALFGGGIGFLGDLDGDLVPDLVIGSSNAPGGGSGRGGAWVLFLAPAQ